MRPNSKAIGISIDEGFDSITFLADRTPLTESVEHFATLADYRDGGIFLAYYAGNSEWERHPVGDEIVMVLEGSTVMTLLEDGVEVKHRLGPNQLIIVPQNTWHRFETPNSVKVMTVTPQPTDHKVELPID